MLDADDAFPNLPAEPVAMSMNDVGEAPAPNLYESAKVGANRGEAGREPSEGQARAKGSQGRPGEAG